jgi:hypothetical protein
MIVRNCLLFWKFVNCYRRAVIPHGGYAMNVYFKSATPNGAPLRALAETRVRFAMRRLTWLVPRAEISLSDINGPRGGVDKRCRVELRTYGGGIVRVTAMARDWRTALESALQRAGRVLLRQLRRTLVRDRARLRAFHGAH